MKSFVLAASLLFLGCLAKPTQLNGHVFEWPFQQNEDDELFVTLQLGTPKQDLNVSLYYFHTDKNLQVVKKSVGGDFNESASTTWYSSRAIYNDKGEYIGLFGYETFNFIGHIFSTAGFILETQPSDVNALIGFGYNSKNTDGLLAEVFSELNTKTISVAFDKYPTNGVISFGLDIKRCYKDWKLVPKAQWTNADGEGRFGVVADKLTVGSYSIDKPGNVTITLNDDLTQWPKKIYYPIIKALGSTNNVSIPCDAKTTIDFQFEDVTLSITPDDYIDKDFPGGECRLAGETVDSEIFTEFSVPKSMIFKKNCLSVDYAKNTVGFATRRNKE